MIGLGRCLVQLVKISVQSFLFQLVCTCQLNFCDIYYNIYCSNYNSKINYLQEVAMTDAEFKPVLGIPQYHVLNKQRERGEITHRSDKKLAKLFERGVTGFRWFCFEKECEGDCDAFIHPEWEKGQDLVVDMSRRAHRREVEEDDAMVDIPGPGTSKLTRPTSQDAIKSEVQRRIRHFRQEVKKHDPTHTVYTVITTDNQLFPPEKQSAVAICTNILEQEDKEMEIPVYTGVNGTEESERYHEDNEASSILKSVRTGRTAIQIGTQVFATRTLARKEEALRLVLNLFYIQVIYLS